jgi:hypothetical protein
MLWAAVAYAGGIVTGVYVSRPLAWWLVAAIVFSASAAFFLRSRGKSAFALGLAALFVTGAWVMQVRAPINQDSPSILAFADGREVIVTAHVVKEGVLQEKKWGDVRQRLDLGTEQIQTGSEIVTVHSGLRVSLYGHEAKTEESNESEESSARPIRWFRYGERLRFPAKIYLPRNFRNPGAFDYTGYLADSGIVAIGSTKLDTVELLPGFAGSRAELWRTRLRRSLIERIHILWKPDESALLDAMLIGARIRSSDVTFSPTSSAPAHTTCW